MLRIVEIMSINFTFFLESILQVLINSLIRHPITFCFREGLKAWHTNSVKSMGVFTLISIGFGQVTKESIKFLTRWQRIRFQISELPLFFFSLSLMVSEKRKAGVKM